MERQLVSLPLLLVRDEFARLGLKMKLTANSMEQWVATMVIASE